MKYKLIVFDIAGTTLQDDNDVVTHAFTEAFRKVGIEPAESKIKQVMGYKKIDAINMVLSDMSIEHSEEFSDEIHTHFLEILNHYYQNHDIHEIDGSTKTFTALKENGYRVALNTGFSRSTTDIILKQLGWDNRLVDATICSDEVDSGRPSADMINQLAGQFHITDNREIVKIGDTPSDLLEGKNAGCGLGIGVLHGTHSAEELKPFPHDYLVSNMNELLSILTD